MSSQKVSRPSLVTILVEVLLFWPSILLDVAMTATSVCLDLLQWKSLGHWELLALELAGEGAGRGEALTLVILNVTRPHAGQGQRGQIQGRRGQIKVTR